ncbi:hypothetical protein GBAR_LOCUS1636 [Geodia barretti]|uniref:Uncharacterized protein n=1 Tax=Geodia barretti TaxID=519541 RepID=A0AA35QXH9_GEOBA|nr:hypothetical protein GBAR_LOCUS1636 [Geodia barretti]
MSSRSPSRTISRSGIRASSRTGRLGPTGTSLATVTFGSSAK